MRYGSGMSVQPSSWRSSSGKRYARALRGPVGEAVRGIVRAALRQSGSAPGEAIMIGDTPYDGEAATAAGINLVALRSGGWWVDQALSGAIAIYDDPSDLLARLASSPFNPVHLVSPGR